MYLTWCRKLLQYCLLKASGFLLLVIIHSPTNTTLFETLFLNSTLGRLALSVSLPIAKSPLEQDAILYRFVMATHFTVGQHD